MNADHVRGREQLFLREIADANFGAAFLRQILAPGVDLHPERQRDRSDSGAEPAQADDAHRQAFGVEPHGDLPGRAGFEPRVLEADLAREFQHQADRQRRGRIAEPASAANDNAALPGRLHVE